MKIITKANKFIIKITKKEREEAQRELEDIHKIKHWCMDDKKCTCNNAQQILRARKKIRKQNRKRL